MRDEDDFNHFSERIDQESERLQALTKEYAAQIKPRSFLKNLSRRSKNGAMKTFLKKHVKEIASACIVLLCILLIGATVVLLIRYSGGLEEQAVSRVENYSMDTTALLSQKINTMNQKVHHAAERMATCKDPSSLAATIGEIRLISDYSNVIDIRFFKGDTEYNVYALPQTFQESKDVLDAVGREGHGMIGTVYDYENSIQSIAFYATLENHPLMDTVIFYYPVSALSSVFDEADEEKLAYADFVALCAKNGEVLRVLHTDTGNLNQHDNIFEYVRETVNNKPMVDELNQHVEEGETIVHSVKIGAQSYVISLGTSPAANGLFVLGLYRAETAYASGYQLINTILSAMLIVFLILIFLIIYTTWNQRRVQRNIKELSYKNPLLGCLSVLGFQNKVQEILQRHRATKFAVVCAEVRFFNFITENYGESEAESLLKYLNVVCERTMGLDETYGYYADGQFFLLLHYKEQNTLVDRLNRLYGIARRYPGLKDDNFSIKLNFGINEFTPPISVGVDVLMDQAIVAKNQKAELGTEQPLKFYNETMRQEYLQKADIETRAEGALANEEFVVFYQPKYNIAKNCVESCEALVRWFDPEQKIYRAPAAFLPIFEANGFIVKLDHFVYERVCRYIADSIERNQLVYPVSVNISRVTAIQTDFKEFYSDLKNRYHIPDGMLVLEFTESFADENYERLNSTITHMHRNGFLCSIDDFGSGYSSYNILKQVRMDEIKLDRFFIKKGISDDRDRLILGQVIQIAKSLGMNIVQEGVETIGEIEMLRELGCDIVQGYYYSKPLMLIDYLSFIEEHRAK